MTRTATAATRWRTTCSATPATSGGSTEAPRPRRFTSTSSRSLLPTRGGHERPGGHSERSACSPSGPGGGGVPAPVWGCLAFHPRGDPCSSGLCVCQVPFSTAMPSAHYSGRPSSKRVACHRSHQCHSVTWPVPSGNSTLQRERFALTHFTVSSEERFQLPMCSALSLQEITCTRRPHTRAHAHARAHTRAHTCTHTP